MSREIHAVTGAFGFAGKYIAKRLLDAGEQVVTLTNSTHRRNPFGDKVTARPFHFDDPAALERELRDVKVLYNTYWVRFDHKDFSHAAALQNALTLFKAAKAAGVERVVHVSITCADEHSPLPYFHGKGVMERALRETGISHAILRPALLYGPEDILINNIAWLLRRFPVFGVFGDGSYHVQPIHVDDLAALAVEQGKDRENRLIQAVGPEDFTYLELIQTMNRLLNVKHRPIIKLPPALGLFTSKIIGVFVGDVFVTRDEIKGLMADNLHAPGAEPTGKTRLSDWIRDNADRLGTKYASELERRQDRQMFYPNNLAI